MQGQIIKQISNLYSVNIDGKIYECTPRGKFRNDKISPLVGDFVVIDIANNYILDILPRKNELQRPSIANVDKAIIVTSVKKPNLSLNLLDKLLSMIIYNNIEPLICLTKLDLLQQKEKKEVKKITKYYQNIGIRVLKNNDKSKLKKTIKNNIIILAGQTGAGKSSLLNALDKNLNLEIKPISKALGRGVHTTRHTQIYPIYKGYIADAPGFSSISLENMNKEEIRNTFIDFLKYPCEFKDCSHVGEKNCNVKKAVEDNKILKSRYENYLKFISEVEK